MRSASAVAGAPHDCIPPAWAMCVYSCGSIMSYAVAHSSFSVQLRVRAASHVKPSSSRSMKRSMPLTESQSQNSLAQSSIPMLW